MTRRAGCRTRSPPRPQVWGGWVVGPDHHRPRGIRAGRLRLRRIRHPARLSRRRRRRAAAAPPRACPDRHRGAAAVGRSRADRPGARRRRRRRDHRDGRIGRAGRRGGGRDPVRTRRRPQLRAAARRASGIDPAALEARRQRVRDDRNGARPRRPSTRSAPCRACPASTSGPADLAISLGYGPAEAWTEPAVRDAMARIQRDRRRGRPGRRHPRRRREDSEKPWRDMGFRMITLDLGVAGAAARRGRTPRGGATADADAERPRRVTTDDRDRVALVTGAARGQGAAIVERLHADGFRVAACDRAARRTASQPSTRSATT